MTSPHFEASAASDLGGIFRNRTISNVPEKAMIYTNCFVNQSNHHRRYDNTSHRCHGEDDVDADVLHIQQRHQQVAHELVDLEDRPEDAVEVAHCRPLIEP